MLRPATMFIIPHCCIRFQRYWPANCQLLRPEFSCRPLDLWISPPIPRISTDNPLSARAVKRRKDQDREIRILHIDTSIQLGDTSRCTVAAIVHRRKSVKENIAGRPIFREEHWGSDHENTDVCRRSLLVVLCHECLPAIRRADRQIPRTNTLSNHVYRFVCQRLCARVEFRQLRSAAASGQLRSI